MLKKGQIWFVPTTFPSILYETLLKYEDDLFSSGRTSNELILYYLMLLFKRIYSKKLPYAQFTCERESDTEFLYSELFGSDVYEEGAGEDELLSPEYIMEKAGEMILGNFEEEYEAFFIERYEELSVDELKDDSEYGEFFENIEQTCESFPDT